MKTEEIIIRKAKVGDENNVAEMIKEGITRKSFIYTGGNKIPDKKKIDKMRNQYKEWGKGFLAFLAIDKKTKKVIGSIQGSFKESGRIRHRIDLGWSVHPDYQGKGIATRLLKTLLLEAKRVGLKRAEAECAVANIASWKLAKKCGFKIEGKKKAGLIMDNGKLVDTYILGRIM